MYLKVYSDVETGPPSKYIQILDVHFLQTMSQMALEINSCLKITLTIYADLLSGRLEAYFMKLVSPKRERDRAQFFRLLPRKTH